MLDRDSVYRKRRSIRSFDGDKAIEKEDLMLILEAGSYAPSGGNSQTTHRLVITDKEILAKLEGLVQQEFAKMEIKEDTYKSIQNSILRSRQGKYFYDYQAPILIVMANKKGYGNAMADSAMMIQNMMLQATELGIGSCYINQLHYLLLEETSNVQRNDEKKTAVVGRRMYRDPEDRAAGCTFGFGG